jgi:hypothetical protein
MLNGTIRHLYGDNMGKTSSKAISRSCRVICIPFLPEVYNKVIEKPVEFRALIDEQIKQFPELFPSEITQQYRMKDFRYSKKLSIYIRRIEICKVNYTIRPSYVMPFMTGMVKDIEKALFLRKFNVPFWALTYVFGKDSMYWYRIETSLGRYSIVGTTIRHPEDLPKHVSADEKHTKLLGEKAYIATTVSNGCILGASVSKSAGEASLKEAYNSFKGESQRLKSDYAPDTVNTDGWPATQNTWKALFPSIHVIRCFLHIYISIRDRTKNKFKDVFNKLAPKLWECYHADNKASFSQRVRRLHEWAKKADSTPSIILDKISKLRENLSSFTITYDFPKAHRTSNMIDRLMQRMDKHLFNTQYFHGDKSSAELNIRGWALILNFAPLNPFTVKKHGGLQSPAERFNKFRYHDNWLQNLLISASLGGYRSPPPNPL